MNIADELRKLQQLRESGSISDDEFAQAKARLLSKPAGPLDDLFGTTAEVQTQRWAMFLHLSQLLNFVFPPAGVVVPIVIWQMKKDDLPPLDEHGKIVVDWFISALLYGVLCTILAFVVVGIPMAMVLAALIVIFPIVGGIKANSGEVWNYPLSISFFK
jgi:uncharacterized protein